MQRLPHQLQQIVSAVMRMCHSLCSDDTTAANAVTQDLYRLLQQLVAAIDAELVSDPSSDIRTSSESWHLLGRLAEGINRHFQIRPRIMFASEDADMQSAAAAARGIKACFTRLIELLSCDEDRAGNVAAFTIYLMDTDGDAETSMRFAFLDNISRRVVAVKRPSQRWHVTIDDEVPRTRAQDDAVTSGFDEVPTPFRKGNFEDLECLICAAVLFQKECDGSVVLLARQLKCPVVVDVTDRTPMGHRHPHVLCESCAQRYFITQKHTTCHLCRHSFREHLCVGIAAALQHQVHEDGHVLWTASPQRRLAALNMLAQVPVEIAISHSLACSVLRSCVVADPDIAAAALRCGRLSVAIENIPQAEAIKWFAELIHARVSCSLNHPTRLHIHICSPSRLDDACRLFEICLQAAAAVVVAGMADIVAAAAQGNRDGVLLHFIADPASVNQRDNGYDTQPDTCTHFLMCLYCLLTLVFAVAEPRCMCLLLQVA